jgi:anti-anti-sigma regulatory factor
VDASSDAGQPVPDCCPQCGGTIALSSSSPAEDVVCPHCAQALWFVRKSQGGSVILTFLPGLRTGSESALRMDEVFAAIGESSQVVVNVSRLRLVNSLFLSMLVRLHLRLESANARLKICGLRPEGLDVFRATRLDHLLDVCPDEQTALGSFGRRCS